MGRVLDAGCGGGRHAVLMAKAKGDPEIVGLDVSPGAVEVTRSRGISAHRGEITAPPAGIGTFDSVMLLGNNLGLLSSREQAPYILAALARLARPGARLYGTGTDPSATANPVHQAYNERNREHGRLPGQQRLRVRHQFIATDWFDYLLMAPDELADIVTTTAWDLHNVTTDGPNYLAELVLRDGRAA